MKHLKAILMIFTISSKQKIDTSSLSPEERHIIQKLVCWQSLVNSISHFKIKKNEALQAGWNNSGPVRESRALSLIIRHLEKKVINRLKGN